MAATAGPAPWSHEDYWKFREQFKRTNKANLKKEGVEWSLTSGYRRRDDWSKPPKKPEMRTVKLYNGKQVQVPVDDYQDFIGHQVSPPAEPDNAIAEYIDKAWESKGRIEIDGVGHIYDLSYAPTYQVMWVSFETDDAVVVFFRVPKEVFSELMFLAESKQTAISTVDGKQRHVLGMKFWDIVRIRGQRTGSRYRFEYTVEGSYEPMGNVVSRIGKGDNELKDTLRAFTRRLTVDAKRVYDNLGSNEERYRFLRRHGVDLPTLSELKEETLDDYSDLQSF